MCVSNHRPKKAIFAINVIMFQSRNTHIIVVNARMWFVKIVLINDCVLILELGLLEFNAISKKHKFKSGC